MYIAIEIGKTMDNHQKLSTLQFEDMPDEILLKVLINLDYFSLIRCGHVSKRVREISHDKSLWEKMKIFERIVPAEFIQFVLDRGCKYLSLLMSEIEGTSLNLASSIV